MYIKDFLSSTPQFKTRVSKYLDKSLNEFLQVYCGYRFQTITDGVLKEFNSLLSCLVDSCVLCSDGEYYSNGVRIITSVDEDRLECVDNHTLSLLLRCGKSIPTSIDFSERVEGLEIISGSSVPFDVYVALKYVKKQLQCIERGISFELTLTDMKRLLRTKKCYYSGVTLTLEGSHHLSLDRIDASLPYVKGNVVACSSSVNGIKNKLLEQKQDTQNMTDKEIKNMLLSFCELL